MEHVAVITEHQGRQVPTIGGLPLFGKHRFSRFPDAWIPAGRFAGTDRVHLVVSAEIRSLLPQAAEEAAAFARKHLTHESVIEGLRREERWSVPLVAIREALINAIVHADYTQQGASIRLALFDDRIAIEMALQSCGMDLTGLSLADLHYAIIRHVIDRGYVPTRLALAAHLGVDPDEVRQALEALQAYHGVVLHPHQPEVWVIHPFSAAPTPFVVRQGGRAWWGNCAWCSLGIAALLGGDDVTIDTTFGAEGRPVTVHVDGRRVREDLWVHFPIPMARAWDNVIYTCSTMLVFESEAAIDTWSERHAIPRGSAQPIQRVYDFAEVWYGRHLDPDWRKWTAEEASGIFKRFGFDGPIWQLSHTAERF